MSAQTDLSNLSVRQFAERIRPQLVPLNPIFSYCSVAVPLTEEDIKEYLEEPIAALPPAISAVLPKVSLLLVPYLQGKNGKEKAPAALPMVRLEKSTGDGQLASSLVAISPDEAVLAFALHDQEVADYHYRFYQMISALMADRLSNDAQNQYYSLLRDELNHSAHGEVDEESWRLKQSLMRGRSSVRRDSKQFLTYARQSFIDTMTLYLHGICCDIDVETGPRQIASRYLRKRLQLLQSLFPPPKGYAVFPEDLSSTE